MLGARRVTPAPEVALNQRLAQYEILEPIGSGGMGDVHRARDTRLGRDVALKRLRAESIGDPAARARLLREARLAAQLAHPNICTIFDAGESDGQIYVAMELVKGRALSEVIGAGMSEPEARRLGAQVADALAHAHEQGVIHRDLKAANVVLGSDGRARVLDFGLATRENAAAPGDETGSMTGNLTLTGAIVGTPGYLAPELLKGAAADARSDLWSLGVLLYEMASGRRPFAGATALELGGAILHQPPAPLPAAVSPGLQAVIQRCLEKDPSRRFTSAAEVRDALRALETPAAPRARGRRAVFTIAVLVAILAGAAALLLPRLRPHELHQRQIGSTDEIVVFGDLSPDGKSVAFLTTQGLEVRDLESGDSRKIALPAGYSSFNPFAPVPCVDWFPDGRQILVSGSGSDGSPGMWTASVLGNDLHRLRDDGGAGQLSPDGKRVAFLRAGPHGPDLWCADVGGGSLRRLAASDDKGVITMTPAWSPAGSRIAFLRYAPGTATTRIESCDLAGASRTIFTDTPTRTLHPYGGLVWLPDHRLIFGLPELPPSQGDYNLWSLDVDPRSARASGAPKRITQWTGASLIEPSASADGRRLGVWTLSYQSDCFVGRVTAGDSMLADPRRLTLDDRFDTSPSWSHDGRTMYFASDRNGSVDIFRQGIDATEAEPVVTGPGGQASPRLSPDGQWLLYLEIDDHGAAGGRAPGTAGSRIMRRPVTGGPAEVVADVQPSVGFRFARPPASRGVILEVHGASCTVTEFDVLRGRGRELARIEGLGVAWDLSPDGRSLAWTDGRDSVSTIHILSLESGARHAVPLRPWPGSGAKNVEMAVSYLAWAPRGGGWYADGAIHATDQATQWRLIGIDEQGATHLLLPPQLWMYGFAISDDGRRFAYTANTGKSAGWLLDGF